MVGFRFGEFTWNKKPALYKAKQIRKKKKKELQKTNQLKAKNSPKVGVKVNKKKQK